MTSAVVFGDVMVRNRIFWAISEHSYFVYYLIISYRRIKVYIWGRTARQWMYNIEGGRSVKVQCRQQGGRPQHQKEPEGVAREGDITSTQTWAVGGGLGRYVKGKPVKDKET